MHDLLSSVAVPTLLIWGDNDTLVPVAFGDILRQEIANSRLLVLKAGHVVMYDRWREFNAAILLAPLGSRVARDRVLQGQGR